MLSCTKRSGLNHSSYGTSTTRPGTSIDLGQLAAKRHLTSGIDCAIAGEATEAVAIAVVAALLIFMKRRLVT